MNLKKISIASLALFAVSAKASLLVTSTGGTDPATTGRTDGTLVTGAQVLIFTPSSSGSITSLGVFDNGGSGFDYSEGYQVNLWVSTGGTAGSSLASHLFTGTAESTGGAGNEWRLFTLPSAVSVTAGTSYAISVVANSGGNNVGLFNFGGTVDGYSDNLTVTSNMGAAFSNVSSATSVIRTQSPALSSANVFDTSSGIVTTVGTYRFVTANFEAVPEPSTYALVAGVGMIGFGLWRRRSVKA